MVFSVTTKQLSLLLFQRMSLDKNVSVLNVLFYENVIFTDHPDLPPSSLFIVGSVFLIQMASIIQRAHLFVSIHHFRSLPVYHTGVCLSAWSVIADFNVFDVCRTFPCFLSKTSRSYGFNFFFMFIKSCTKCSSCFINVAHIAGLTWDLVHTIGLVCLSST